MLHLESSKRRFAAFKKTQGSKKKPEEKKSPEAEKKPKVARWDYVRRFGVWVRPQWRPIALIIFISLVVAALDMLWPLAMGRIVNMVQGADAPGAPPAKEQVKKVVWLCLGVLAVVLTKQLLDYPRAFQTSRVSSRLIVRLRRRLHRQMLALPIARLAEMKSGGVVSRLSTDIESLGGLIQQALIAPAVAVIRIVLTVAVLLWLSWQLAVATLVAMPVAGLLTFLWLKRVRPLYRSLLEDRSGIDARVGETFGGIRVVRTFSRERREQLTYGLAQHTVVRKQLAAERLGMLLESGWGLLIPLASMTVIGVGAWLVLNGHGKVGDLFIFQIYAVMLLGPIIQLVASVSQTQKGLTALQRVFDTLEESPDKPDQAGALPAPAAIEELRLESVCFEYNPGVPVLKDISLRVPGGETLALVGPSGSGKSTLADVIARFHDPTAGAVLLNGVDLRRYQLRSYRSLLAIVPQDVFLFDGTVAENIAYGRRGATQIEIQRAAEMANAYEFIAQMPEGYTTIIGERGFKLSGGQRQRLSIARAILADPKILILDEATSNLDSASEALIQQALSRLVSGRTTVIIAHRMATIRNAHQIAVIGGGVVQEVGTHAELMAHQGPYAAMVQMQQLTPES